MYDKCLPLRLTYDIYLFVCVTHYFYFTLITLWLMVVKGVPFIFTCIWIDKW